MSGPDGPLGHDAVRLVGRQQLDPPGGPPVVVPAADQLVGVVLPHQPRDEVDEAADGVDRCPVVAP